MGKPTTIRGPIDRTQFHVVFTHTYRLYLELLQADSVQVLQLVNIYYALVLFNLAFSSMDILLSTDIFIRLNLTYHTGPNLSSSGKSRSS